MSAEDTAVSKNNSTTNEMSASQDRLVDKIALNKEEQDLLNMLEQNSVNIYYQVRKNSS